MNRVVIAKNCTYKQVVLGSPPANLRGEEEIECVHFVVEHNIMEGLFHLYLINSGDVDTFIFSSQFRQELVCSCLAPYLIKTDLHLVLLKAISHSCQSNLHF